MTTYLRLKSTLYPLLRLNAARRAPSNVTPGRPKLELCYTTVRADTVHTVFFCALKALLSVGNKQRGSKAVLYISW